MQNANAVVLRFQAAMDLEANIARVAEDAERLDASRWREFRYLIDGRIGSQSFTELVALYLLLPADRRQEAAHMIREATGTGLEEPESFITLD